ncbi:MAG: hypothetical protein H7Y31_13790, partial [Chitinophagaceae bacterium]|nr:hypothetical protein [Chitinophagaceae bacterium]
MFLKNLFTILFIVACVNFSMGQSPLQFNYQAIARNNVGVPLSNQNVTLRFSIRSESVEGNVEFMEIRKLQTNQFGMFTVSIGSEGAFFATGPLSEVKWETGRKFLQVEMDYTGGNNYADLGATQLVSVPYALFALRSLDGGGSSTFAGAGRNGISIEDSTAVLGNKIGMTSAQLLDDRYVPLNSRSVNFTDGASSIGISKQRISIEMDSIGGIDGATGGTFIHSKPIFPRADAVSFTFNRVAVQQHNGSVSPNEVVIWGHNINKGGGSLITGLPGIGYSL